VEDLISAWDLMDIKPTRGHYTWTKKRVGPGHISTCLDRFLIHSSFLTLGLKTSSEILPHSTSDHKPISLELRQEQDQGPIPFRFNLAWIQDKDFLCRVSNVWTRKVNGSAFYVWEEKLRRLKAELKGWEKKQADPITLRLESQRHLESHQLALENKEITQQDLLKEEQLQRQWYKSCRDEESYWRKNSRSLWLKEGDRNTSYFHKQVEARKHFKAVIEIQVQNTTVSEPEDIRKATFETFKSLYTENKSAGIVPQMYPLSVVPKLINNDINRNLLEEVSQQEIKEVLDQMHPDKAPGPDGFTARFFQQS